MSISHRTNRLKLITSPKVEQLQNGRYRLTFSLSPKNPEEDWYFANKSRIFADYGSLQSAEMFFDNPADGINPRTGEAYDDMRLVVAQSAPRSIREGGGYIVTFVYETLTGSFVQETDDKFSETENGLRTLTRVSIAKAGTDYTNTVGSTFIDSQIDAETAVRVFLAEFEIDNTDSFRRVTERYIEAGVLSVNKTSLSDGVYRVSTTFAHTEGSVVGPIVSRKTQNSGGFKTITVDSLQDGDGTSIIGSGTNLVHQYKTFVPFQYPGIIDVTTTTGATSGGNNYVNVVEEIKRPPAQSQVLATTYVFFQTASDLVQADYSYDSSDGLWSPNNWASSEISFSSGGFEGFSISKGYRGYRTSSPNASGTRAQNVLAFPFAQYNHSTKMGGFDTTINYSVVLEKGPPDPISSKWVVTADIKPAFDDVSGTTYYKKTIVVSDTIPTQPATATLPYEDA